MTYEDLTTKDSFPKTFVVRNTRNGMVWQIYHPDTQEDVDNLSKNAFGNGFLGNTLEDHQPELEETWSDWRETKVW